MTQDDLFARLRADGQPDLVGALLEIQSGKIHQLLVSERVGFSDDASVDAAVRAFVEACGGQVVLVPHPDKPSDARHAIGKS